MISPSSAYVRSTPSKYPAPPLSLLALLQEQNELHRLDAGPRIRKRSRAHVSRTISSVSLPLLPFCILLYDANHYHSPLSGSTGVMLCERVYLSLSSHGETLQIWDARIWRTRWHVYESKLYAGTQSSDEKLACSPPSAVGYVDVLLSTSFAMRRTHSLRAPSD
jgi:hypothetical protein